MLPRDYGAEVVSLLINFYTLNIVAEVTSSGLTFFKFKKVKSD